MHPLMLKAVIGACRARIAEGDCPTTKAIPVEQLEEAIVELAAAPVPARECPHEWEPRWIESLGEGTTRWAECKFCGEKRPPPPAADK